MTNTERQNQRESFEPATTGETAKIKGKSRAWVLPLLGILFLAAIVAGIWYFQEQQKYTYSDKAQVSVPMIQLTPKAAGKLKEIFVHEGEQIFVGQTVAQVGEEMITAEISGIAAEVKQDIGAIYNPGQPVVTMYDPSEMRIVAGISEDKGLKDIGLLHKVRFTVDAFGSQEFEGIVEEISLMSRSGDVVFNISDKRQEQEFDVKIRYDLKKYPSFKNGMSARAWILK